MPLSRPSSDKLVAYLSQLSPDVAAFLIREIELHRLSGKDDPAYDAILTAAREVVRMSERVVDRIDTPLRLFCDPFAEMLVDEDWGVSRPARVSRASIELVWRWLATASDAAGRIGELTCRLATEARRGAGPLTGAVQSELIACAADAIEAALAAADISEKERRRFEMLVGGNQALHDAHEMAAAFRAFDGIRKLRSTLPQSIRDLDEQTLDDAAAALAAFQNAVPDRPDIGFAVLLAHFATPSQTLRLAVKGLGTDDGGAVARSAYGALGNLLLGDTEIAARRVDQALREGTKTAAVLYALAVYHRYAEGIETELSLDARGEWGTSLALSRRIASQALDAEIRRAPGLIAELFRPRLNRMSGHSSPPPDSHSADLAARALSLAAGCRPFIDQLSLHEAVMRSDETVNARLDAIGETLLDDLREAAGEELNRAGEWFDVLVSLIAITRGDGDAALLARSGRVARQARDEVSAAG